MSNSSMMHWSPDREPDPTPIHGWDDRLDPSVKADITFRETDDPEGARTWLNARLDQTMGGPEQEVERVRSVPFPPENVRPPETEFVREIMDNPRITPEQWESQVRERIASLPDGEVAVRGQWIGPYTTTEETRMSWSHAPGTANDPVRPLMQPHDAPAWPSPETIERPNLPRRSHAPVALVTIRVRTADGLEETYEIENPTDLIFRMGTDLETIDMRDGRVLPGARSLRELAVFALSPQNWRRLPTRRWHT